MSLIIPSLAKPELFLGFVTPIGADLAPVLDGFEMALARRDYRVVRIRVTDVFTELVRRIPARETLVQTPLHDRYRTHILYGNQIRAHFNDDSILAALTVARVSRSRAADEPYARTAYLLHQFKREEEIELLRSVYGPAFFQVSAYSRRGARVADLARRFRESAHRPGEHAADAERIVTQDEDEREQPHGQRVGSIFHNADVILNVDQRPEETRGQIERFSNLLFGANDISPGRAELGMFMARSAALRSADLSRQVGAAVFTAKGEVIALGCNEVPAGGGGQYWADEAQDGRDYHRGFDANDRRKRQILGETARLFGADTDLATLLGRRDIRDSSIMDALEYSRVVHAEMAAITEAARLGRSVRDATLFCTTFPCHMCAKHIVAAGIARVVFLEPYPKSLAADMHADSIAVEGGERGSYQTYAATAFEHFHGITPRRYADLFARGRRKNADGSFQRFRGDEPKPIIDMKIPVHAATEDLILARLAGPLADILAS
jgi:deoxycytidylate deaminase